MTQHLALASTVDEQLRRLPSERRNRLKRVEKLKLSVDVGDPTDPMALADLCAIYSENMRDLGSPHARPPVLQPTRRAACAIGFR